MHRKFIIHNSKFIIAVAAFFFSATAKADLEWINGGVPKNTVDKTGNTVIKDAPLDEKTLAAAGNQDIVVSHMITCTKIVNQYPIDSVNYFYIGKSPQICYYAYFLMRPSSRIHTATVEWFSPTNLRIAKFDQEFRVGFVDRLLTIRNETYQWFLINMTVGMEHVHPEFGQSGLPRDVGLYTVHLTVDGQLVGITFFYVKQEDNKPAPPLATVPPVSKPSSNAMPMNTPLSNAPIQKRIP